MAEEKVVKELKARAHETHYAKNLLTNEVAMIKINIDLSEKTIETKKFLKTVTRKEPGVSMDIKMYSSYSDFDVFTDYKTLMTDEQEQEYAICDGNGNVISFGGPSNDPMTISSLKQTVVRVNENEIRMEMDTPDNRKNWIRTEKEKDERMKDQKLYIVTIKPEMQVKEQYTNELPHTELSMEKALKSKAWVFEDMQMAHDFEQEAKEILKERYAMCIGEQYNTTTYDSGDDLAIFGGGKKQATASYTGEMDSKIDTTDYESQKDRLIIQEPYEVDRIITALKHNNEKIAKEKQKQKQRQQQKQKQLRHDERVQQTNVVFGGITLEQLQNGGIQYE